MTPRTAGLLAIALLLTVLFFSAAVAAPAGRPPLTNEDVVRLVMTGTSEKDILVAIESRPVDFDLAPDMVEELLRAGVNERIVEAMRHRQAAMPRSEPSPTPAPAPGGTGTLRVEFEDKGNEASAAGRSAIALKSLPKGMRRRGGTEVGLMTDMALAVLCISADHVPDHWDGRSPLQGAPRHELLLFRPGSATEKVKGHEVLYLDHLPSYEISVPSGDHNIVVGAAGKQAGSGTWRLIESDGARVSILPGRTTRVKVEARSGIKGSAMTGFTVNGEWKIVAVEVLEPEPDGAVAPAASDAATHP